MNKEIEILRNAILLLSDLIDKVEESSEGYTILNHAQIRLLLQTISLFPKNNE